MDRQYYLDLAASELSMPIGTDLVLHEKADPESILCDGEQLGRVIQETAERYHTPIAVPHMDLELEKYVMLEKLGIPTAKIAKYHFAGCPSEAMMEELQRQLPLPINTHLQAHIDSVAYIAQQTTLLPVGMCIGPFSLMTKLISDPISPICMAGAGVSADEDDEIRAIERTLEMATLVIEDSLRRQIAAGAKAIFIAEPAANKVYLSPNQIEAGSDIFDRFVMTYNLRLKSLMEKAGVDLIFHCCGELIDYMVKKFTELHPVILSLGSSRKLWEDAAIVPKDIVLFGNLPSKQFYSDGLITRNAVSNQAIDLRRKMQAANHPFILGSECDVLSVPGCEETIKGKVDAIVSCACGSCMHA